MQRVHSIDYLRGMMALAVLLYHFLSWTIGIPDTSSVLGRLGIYAVSTFYIVSGISMYFAYHKRKWDHRVLTSFVFKRYLRLAPAFWLGCILMIFLSYLTSKTFRINWEVLLSNLSLTFGFTNPRSYIVAGGWSIGNEMVFYLFLPLVFWFTSVRAAAILVALVISLGYYVYYPVVLMASGKTMVDVWGQYIQPGNQAFLFFLGIAIAWASARYDMKRFKYHREILVLSLITFAVYPSSGNAISIVTGHERFIYTAICGLVCLSVMNTEFKLNPMTDKLLKTTGDISYGVYILHGAFAMYTLQLLAPAVGVTTPTGKFALLLIVTAPLLITFAYYFYRKVEEPIMKYGKRGDLAAKSKESLPKAI